MNTNMLKSNEPNEKEINNIYTVYMHVNKINNKKYIGITRRRPEERWMSNGLGYKRQGFYNAIKKYGWNNFEHIILAQNLSFQEASNLEIELIKYYDSMHNGYNQSFGGESSKYYKIPEEIRQKISESKIKNQSHKGENNSQYGISPKQRMDENTYLLWKRNMSNSLIKIKESERKQIICVNTGKVFLCAKDVENKMGLSAKRIAMNCYKHLHSDLYDDNGVCYYWDYFDNDKTYILQDYIAQYARNPIICIEDNIIFTNAEEIHRVKHVDPSSVLKCCKGKQLTCKGKHYMYYKNFNNFNVGDDEADAICIGDAVLKMFGES